MKNIRLILLTILTISFATANAQLKIEKRKHLKGYNIDYTKKPAEVSDFKIEDGKRITAAEVARKEAEEVKATENVVVLPVAESSFYNESAPVVAPVTSAPTNLTAAKPTGKLQEIFFFRKGAGLVIANKLDNVKAKIYKAVPAAQAGPGEIFAIIGFVAGILSILSFLGPGLLFFGVIGLIFSLLGMDSAYGNFAKWGLILSIIGLALAILYVITWNNYWGGHR